MLLCRYVASVNQAKARENTRHISINISISRRTNPLICLMLFSLKHKHEHKHKKSKPVRFSCAYDYAYALMRLCLCLCACENSIRQISGFVLLMFLLLLTLMSRMFSLVMLMLGKVR